MKHNQEQQTHEKESGLAGLILERIESEKIEPTSRWYFIFSESVMWGLWIVSVVLGASAVAVTLYVSMHAGYTLYEATHENWLEFALEAAPVIWLIVFVLMAAIAYYNVRHTKRGYRYPVWQILMSSILLSLLGGIILQNLGAGHLIETAMKKTMPMYPTFEDMEMRWWQKPSAGLFVGHLVEFDTENEIATFVDMEDTAWRLKTDELEPFEFELLTSGKLVRVIGIQGTTTPGLVYGCVVFPWEHEEQTRLHDMRQERREFAAKVDLLKRRIERQLDRAELELFGTTSEAEKDEPMGMCPTLPLLKRML